MFKPPHNCTHLTHEQSNAQNSPREASTVNESEEENFKTCTQLEITSCSFCFCNSNSSMKSKVSYIGWGDGTETYNNPRSWNLPPAQSLSHIWLFATPWTVAGQAPQFMELPRQEHWSGLPFPSPETYLTLVNYPALVILFNQVCVKVRHPPAVS